MGVCALNGFTQAVPDYSDPFAKSLRTTPARATDIYFGPKRSSSAMRNRRRLKHARQVSASVALVRNQTRLVEQWSDAHNLHHL
jgi:hypothetical protein